MTTFQINTRVETTPETSRILNVPRVNRNVQHNKRTIWGSHNGENVDCRLTTIDIKVFFHFLIACMNMLCNDDNRNYLLIHTN